MLKRILDALLDDEVEEGGECGEEDGLPDGYSFDDRAYEHLCL